jgi:uncharacterized membrane protein YkoI
MKKYLFCLAIATSLGAGGAALAEGSDQAGEARDAKALLAAKVSAVQAAQAAEAKVGGKVSSLSFETGQGNDAPFYHVEVVTPDGVQQDVAVDATTAEIAKVLTSEGDDGGGENHEVSGSEEDSDGDQ